MHRIDFQLEDFMTLSDGILQSHLKRPFRYVESVVSTNDLAKIWLDEGAPDGAAVIANEQVRGRGRQGRHWHTPPHAALALSVILRPPVPYFSRVSLIGALSVYDLAEQVGCADIGIKWPNDVQIHGRKVGGILPEAVWKNDEPVGVVLGIGVNVRVDFSQTALKDAAISLESATHRRLNRAELTACLLERVDLWYRQIASDALFITWKHRLNMLGRRIKAEGVAGLAFDVRPDGSLLVRDDFARIQSVVAGDIFVVNHSEDD